MTDSDLSDLFKSILEPKKSQKETETKLEKSHRQSARTREKNFGKEIDINDYFSEIPYGLTEEDISYEKYFKIKAINSSAVKYGDRSPYHLDKYLTGYLREEKKEYNFGNYFHCLVFEEEKFYKYCYIMPETPDGEPLNRRKNLHKDFWEKCVEIANGREIIKKEEFEQLEKLRDALYEHNKFFPLDIISPKGFTETVITAKNADLQINCKGKLDKFVPNQFILDLKSTKDATEKSFMRDFSRYEYKVQAAFYVDLIAAAGFDSNIPFVFVAQEHSPPYFTKMYEVSDEKLNEGRQIYVKRLDEYIKYKRGQLNIFDLVVI